jgi:hypothetical protein
MFDYLFDFALAVFTVAPLGCFVLFWIAFREDVGIHPIYRQARIETLVAGQEKKP